MSDSTFKISYDGELCRYETEEGEYEFYKKHEDSENYFQIEIERNEIEWRSILGRRYKKGVMKVLGSLGAEAEIEAKNSELPFNVKMQQLLRKGEIIAACEASVKHGVIGTY